MVERMTLDMHQSGQWNSYQPVNSAQAPMGLQRVAINAAPMNETSPVVQEVLRSQGQPLDAGSRDLMEPRFAQDFSSAPIQTNAVRPVPTNLMIGASNDHFEEEARAMAQNSLGRSAPLDGPRRDFSRVRIHADDKAAESARAVNAQAYTVANHIVFGEGRYAPQNRAGQELLAHELTHVVQQAGRGETRISRFSDTDHHIVEEVALKLEALSAEEIKQIHLGNTKRDYSQLPAQLNLVLLCDPSNYGGYKAVEHIDNFRWDEELQKWQSRENPGAFGKKDPITHIDEELGLFVGALPDKAAFQHVGSAFHTIEDFFAHSNFIELTHNDYTHGRELVTGSVGGPDDVSILKILESISSSETAPYYGAQANRDIAAAPQQSHPRMAKDYRSNRYYMEAVVLATLVIQEIGPDIVSIRDLTSKEQRMKYVRDVIMTKVKRYLRPPNPQDKWWEALRSARGRGVEAAIRETAARTPVTTNQCILSPLRSIEASRDSNLKLIGPTFPVSTKHGHVLVQVGTGFSIPPAFASPTGAVLPRSPEFVPVGVQITGRF
jgi:uncharacterized protein DUF4157/heterokaryon incompatibility protein Het-C